MSAAEPAVEWFTGMLMYQRSDAVGSFVGMEGPDAHLGELRA